MSEASCADALTAPLGWLTSSGVSWWDAEAVASAQARKAQCPIDNRIN